MSQGNLWWQRDFKIFLSANAIVALGQGMQFIASSWLATELTGKGYAAAIILMVQTIPSLLLVPFLGVWVDRLERRKLAAALDVFRALAVLGVPILYWSGSLQAWHLYAMTFLVALGDVLHWPTRGALIREIVPKTQLLPANTANMTAIQLGMILGAGSSGFLLDLAPPITVMLMNAVTFSFSGLLCLLLRTRSAATAPSSTVGPSGFLEDFRAGLHYL